MSVFPQPGRPAKTLRVLDVAPLTEADLGDIPPQVPSPLRSLRQTHHTIARLLALGHKDIEVSAITGYSVNRIRSLRSDPSFAELESFYKSTVQEEFGDLVSMLAALSREAAAELLRRLDENPESLSTKHLLELLESAADRTGHAPVRRTELRTVNITGEQLSAIRAELEAARAGTVRPRLTE